MHKLNAVFGYANIYVEPDVVSVAEAVPTPVPDVGCGNPEDSEEASGPQNRGQKQEDEGKTCCHAHDVPASISFWYLICCGLI